MSGKFALIIGNTEYTDPGLAQLTAPGKDAEDFARVLKDTEIGAFDSVKIILNQASSSVIEAIDVFFDEKKPDDLLVLYFSGHGVRDELGALYLAVSNTNRARLRSTALKSDYIRESMDQSRSRRQVLILDCCNSGSFAQGTKAAAGVSIGTASAFEGGYGRVILTASDSTQFAWNGDKVTGETDRSVFTHFLVEGLEGDADSDGDGRITVDELYDYAYEKVRLATPKLSPSKFSSRQQGEIILRQGIRMENIKPVPLPPALLDSIENPFPDVRLGAVQQLIKLLNGKNLGLARSAQEALGRIVEEDDSRMVIQAAFQALEANRRGEQVAGDKTVIEQTAIKAGTQSLIRNKPVEEHLAKTVLDIEQPATGEVRPVRGTQEKKSEEKSLARTEIEQESAKHYAERQKKENEAAQKTEIERKSIAESERLLAKKKSDEERVAKAKINDVTSTLVETPIPKSAESHTHQRAARAPAKKTSTKPLVSSARPASFISAWSWIAVALIVAAVFAVAAAAGGFLWWRSSSNELRETPPPLVEVPATEAAIIFDPTNIAFPTNAQIRTSTPSPVPTDSPIPIVPYFTATRDMFCYDGPSTTYDTHWELYMGETAAILAKWSGDPNWLAVDINEPAETRTDCCWISASDGTLNVSLDQVKVTSIVPDRMNCSAIQ